jgi:hypothetical protein
VPRSQPGGRSSPTAAPRRPRIPGVTGMILPLAVLPYVTYSTAARPYGRPGAGCAYPPVQPHATPVM